MSDEYKKKKTFIPFSQTISTIFLSKYTPKKLIKVYNMYVHIEHITHTHTKPAKREDTLLCNYYNREERRRKKTSERASAQHKSKAISFTNQTFFFSLSLKVCVCVCFWRSQLQSPSWHRPPCNLLLANVLSKRGEKKSLLYYYNSAAAKAISKSKLERKKSEVSFFVKVRSYIMPPLLLVCRGKIYIQYWSSMVCTGGGGRSSYKFIRVLLYDDIFPFISSPPFFPSRLLHENECYACIQKYI